MTSTARHCPETPEITGPVFDAVACRCCGAPLELTCAGKCSAEHVRLSVADAAARLRSPALAFPDHPKSENRGPSKPRTYAPKQCALCHQPFQPTGPRSVVCERCKALKSSKTPVESGAASGAEGA